MIHHNLRQRHVDDALPRHHVTNEPHVELRRRRRPNNVDLCRHSQQEVQRWWQQQQQQQQHARLMKMIQRSPAASISIPQFSNALLSLRQSFLRFVERKSMKMIPLLLLSSALCPVVVTAQEAGTATESTSQIVSAGPFARLDCDPCIQRRDYTIRAIVHGSANDQFWLQVQASMIQAANDMGVNFQMQLQDGITRNRNAASVSIGSGTDGSDGGGGGSPSSSSSSSSISSTIEMADAIRDSASQLLSGRVSLTADTSAESSISGSTSAFSSSKRPVDALIVTIPNSIVKSAVDDVLAMGMPVVVMNVDYPSTSLLQAQLQQQLGQHPNTNGQDTLPPPGLLAYVSQDDYRAGLAAGDEILQQMMNDKTATNTTDTQIRRAIFINPTPADDVGQIKNRMSTRYAGFRDALLRPTSVPHNPDMGSNETGLITNATDGLAIELEDDIKIEVEELIVDPANVFEHVTLITQVFEGCRYDAVVLGSAVSVNVAVGALEENSCSSSDTLVGVMDSDPIIYRLIVQRKFEFGMSEQPYLQSAIPVVLASIFVTTDKSLPIAQDGGMFETGPRIIRRDSVPTDSLQTCEADAFPICPNTKGIVAGKESDCTCTDRSQIRIGGVLHGVTTDSFWDPVFSAAAQAASDLGITLDLERFQPQETNTLVHEQMAARIKTLCESGVDGIFVTIPSDIVIPSIERCQQLKVPVVSVNSGGDIAESMDLLHHVGQAEYNAGVAAGERMLEAGMKHGYCLDHAWGNLATEARCRGFGDAMQQKAADDSDIMYMGAFKVPADNKVQFTIDVEGIVSEEEDESNRMPWEGVGILSLGSNNILPLRDLKDEHEGVLVGTFDVSPDILESIRDGYLLFGMDQQPFFQGKMPVYLLAYLSYTKQSLLNFYIQSGPSFITEPPSEAKEICESNFYQVCPDHPGEEYNFLSQRLLLLGTFLVGIMVFWSLFAAGWTIVFRAKWVVKVSQPLFLMLLLVGCFVSSLSLIFMGVEAEYRFEQDTATGEPIPSRPLDLRYTDASCMIGPWFYGVGFVLTFSALFAKIQRVKLIYHAGMNMRRKAVKVTDVVHVIASMMVVEISILVSWQVTSPFVWERSVLSRSPDGYPLESSGRCTSDQGWYFMLGLVLFHVLCLFYALVLCFQTKDINSDFAESSYISLAVIFMFQMWVLVVPISALVQDNTNVFYFVRLCAVFLQNFTVLGLIFVPKMIRLHLHSDEDVTSNLQHGSQFLSGHRPNSTVYDIDYGRSVVEDDARRASGTSSTTVRSKSSLRKNPNSIPPPPSLPLGQRKKGGLLPMSSKEPKRSNSCGSSEESSSNQLRRSSASSSDVLKTVRFQKDSYGSLSESNTSIGQPGEGQEEDSPQDSGPFLTPSIRAAEQPNYGEGTGATSDDRDARSDYSSGRCGTRKNSKPTPGNGAKNSGDGVNEPIEDGTNNKKLLSNDGYPPLNAVTAASSSSESSPSLQSSEQTLPDFLILSSQILYNWEELGLQSEQHATDLLELLNPKTTQARRKMILATASANKNEQS